MVDEQSLEASKSTGSVEGDSFASKTLEPFWDGQGFGSFTALLAIPKKQDPCSLAPRA